jgi:hypothetical protein
MRIVNSYSGHYAIITVTDQRGRTKLKLIKEKIKEKPDSGWTICDFVTSRKHLIRFIEAHRTGQPSPASHPGHLAPDLLKRLPDGRLRLDLLGPPLFWEHVRAVADGMVAAGYLRAKMTVDELYVATTYIE